MNKILIIYFDFSQLSSNIMETILLRIGYDFFKIKDGLFLVSTNITPKNLFEAIIGNFHQPVDINIFVCEMNHNAYWGYMNGELWDWINKHKPLL